MGQRIDARGRIEALEQALDREQGKRRALQDIGVALGSTLDLEELLSLVLERISGVMEAERATLFLIDDDSGELVSKFAHGGRTHEIRMKVGDGLAGWVAENGRALNVKDAYQDVRFDAVWDRVTGFRTRSTLCVPMKNHLGRIIGVVQVLNKRDGYFGLEDESLLSSLASQAAVSIENSKLFLSVVGKNMELLETKEQLERKVRELDVLFEISQVSASAGRLDELLEGVLARAMRAIDAEAGSILLADERNGDLRFRCALGGEAERVRRVRIGAGVGISGWVATHGQPQVVNDVDTDARHSQQIAEQVGYHPRSVLCVPLHLEDGCGALELLNKSRGHADFGEDDLKLASVIAGHVSTAIDLARSRERRERQERLSTIGQLLSSVLHDLKTPMTIISGYAKFVVEEQDADARRTLGEAIAKQCDIISVMTREILAFARGDSQVWVRRVYLAQYFEQLLEQLELELKGRNVRVELDLNDRGTAHLDEHKIQRAVHNLARNAAQAMGEQGGTFTIGVDRRKPDGALVLTFTDTGPGVPEEIRERLFESFISHGKPGGTGLGLAIVRKVVDDHGGSIEVDSRPGCTRFTLVLPQPPSENLGPPDASKQDRSPATA